MPVKLKDALKEILQGWQSDLPPAWRTMFEAVDPALGECDPSLELEYWEPVFPVRRGKIFPGAPAGAHMFRAFDGIDPDGVRCVILGQDPYPAPDFATGRAFEAGNVATWREFNKMFSRSMRAFMQMICAARTGDATYCNGFARWSDLLDDVEGGRLLLEPPGEIADRWVDQGVLLLNSSLTLSRFRVEGDPHQTNGHLTVWKPFISAILRQLADRGQPLVILAFGAAAKGNLEAAGLGKPLHLETITRPHPAEAEAVLRMENPFVACNRFLTQAGAAAVDW